MANDIQIIVDSSDLQKAVDWMDKMGQSGKKLGTTTKTLQQEFDKYNRELKQNQAELKRIKMATDPVYAADQKLKNMKRLLRSEIEQGNMSLREAGAEMLRYRKSVNSMTTAVQLSGKAARRKEVAFQQAGYQVQDFIVQVQAGTNPLIAFSQQGSQLAGFFAGPWGAAIGVGIAALSTFAMVILSLKRDMGDFKKELDEVNASIALAGSGAGSSGMLAANLKLMDAYDNLSATRKGYAQELASGEKDLVDLANFEIAAAQEKVDIASQERQELQSKIDQLKTINALSGSEVLEAQNLQANMARQARARKTAADEAKKLADEQEKINNKAKDQLGLIQQQVTLSAIEKELGKDSLEYQGQKNRFILYNLQASLRQQKVEESIIEELLEATTAHQENLASIKEQTAEAARLKKQFDEAFKTRTLEYKLRFSGEATVMGQSVTASGKKMKPKQSYEELIALGMSPEQIENLFGMKPPKGKGGPKAPKDALVSLMEDLELQRELLGVEQDRASVLQRLGEDRGKYTQDQIQQAVDATNAIRLQTEELEKQERVADTISQSFGDAFMSIVDGTMSAKDAFRSMAADIIRELYRILVVETMVQSIKRSIFPFADGGVIQDGKQVQAYANGGVVGGPTYFPMAGGKTGLMGEAGPEAIMPLKRGKGGKLGVEVSGDTGAVNIVQNFSFAANGDESVKRLIAEAAPKIANMTQQQIMDARRRGGQMRSTFG